MQRKHRKINDNLVMETNLSSISLIHSDIEEFQTWRSPLLSAKTPDSQNLALNYIL